MEKKPEEKEAKGFSGLDSMVSDVDETIASLPKAKAPEITQPVSPVEDRKQSERVGSSDKALPGNFSTSGKWLAGIVVAVVLFGIVFENLSRTDTPATVYKPSPEPPPAPAIAQPPIPASSQKEDINSNVFIPPGTIIGQAPSQRAHIKIKPTTGVPDVEKPPVGSNLVLNAAQIRYCLTEKIKISSLEPVVKQYDSTEVDDYNVMISDYNGRCGSYRYRVGTLENIRSEVQSHRVSIESEAKAQWKLKHAGAIKSSPSNFRSEGSATSKPPKTSLPDNSHINIYGNNWECDNGYRRSGNACDRVILPENSHINIYGNDWECDNGYRRAGSACDKVHLPENSHINIYGNDWECDTGYRRAGSACDRVILPENSHINIYGNDWECDNGYRRTGPKCAKVNLPENSHINIFGNDWECNYGFRRTRNICVPVGVNSSE